MPNTHETLGGLFSDIADAIRAKTGGSADIVADNFPSAIAAIPSVTIEPLSVTENGTYTAPSGKAYSPVTVSVSGSKTSLWKTIVPSTTAQRLEFTDNWIAENYENIRFVTIKVRPRLKTQNDYNTPVTLVGDFVNGTLYCTYVGGTFTTTSKLDGAIKSDTLSTSNWTVSITPNGNFRAIGTSTYMFNNAYGYDIILSKP